MSLVDWEQADFRFSPPCGRARPPDPWREPRLPPDALRGKACQTSESWDWLDELRSAAPEAHSVPIRLPTVEPILASALDSIQFDPNARQQPWRSEISTGERATSRARQKAANLAMCFEFSGPGKRTAALASLTELFEEFEHSATYQALLDQARTGLDFETLGAMADLKRVWLMTPAWWSRRRYCRIRRVSQIRRASLQDRAAASAGS
jgi:hypothetical protein